MEKRRTPRYPFVASAELIDIKSQSQLSTRVSDISLYGCYFDTISPFPEGTSILLKIVRVLVFFEAQARVVYSQPNLGMGAEFEEIHPYFLKVLQGWLVEAEIAQKTSARVRGSTGRDSAAGIGFTTTYKYAGTANRRGNRTTPQELWVEFLTVRNNQD
jgi:hypothetical protein